MEGKALSLSGRQWLSCIFRCSGSLGKRHAKAVLRQKVREMTGCRRVLSGAARGVRTGRPHEEQEREPVRLSTPYLSVLGAARPHRSLLCKAAGLVLRARQMQRKGGWTVRSRHWAHSSQGVGSTHSVHRTGNLHLRKANHRLTSSLAARVLEHSVEHTPAALYL